MNAEVPENLLYTKEHEWIRRDGDVVVLGITAHAAEELGDITMVSLPEVGDTLTAGDTVGDIDSVKAVSELFSPVDGEVTELNPALEETPEKVNEDPYGDGWMLKLRPSDGAQLDGLMNAEAYRTYLSDLD